MESVTSLGAARRASGLYMQDCADIFDVSLPTYRNIERDDSLLTLAQLEALLPHLNNISVGILKERVEGLFLTRE